MLLLVAITRRALLRLFLIPGLAVFPVTYWVLYHESASAMQWGIFFCGLLVVAQFSYFGEYLPKVFPMHLRGTGGSFATNVGGRMVGTSMATLNTSLLAPLIAGGEALKPAHVATAAGIIAVSLAVVALIVGLFLPEPPAEARPE